MPTTTVGTVTKAGTTRPTAKGTWTLITGEGEITASPAGAVVVARRERHPARKGAGGRAAGVEPWTPAPIAKDTTAEGAAPATATAWMTNTSEEKEEEGERGGTGAETISTTTRLLRNLRESWSHWRNPSTFCWSRTDPAKVSALLFHG